MSPNTLDTRIPMVYLGPEPWDGLWRNRHYLMSRFARSRKVVYIEPPFGLKKLRRRVAAGAVPRGDLYRAKMEHIQNNLFVCRTGALCPISGRKPISHASWWNWRQAVNRELVNHGVHNFILWISRPTWYPAMSGLNSCLVIYHVVDEYSAYTMVTEETRRSIVRTEEKILERADLVIVVSKSLLASKSKLTRSAHIVANGVDIDEYTRPDPRNQIPSSLVDIPRPLVGYSGLIAGRLDLALILKLAGERPNYSIVLLGTVNELGCESLIQSLRECENVHFLSTKPAHEVPGYIKQFDVCIIPYTLNERAVNADPLKLYEYAAAGKEVVCTDFVAARNAGRFCRIAASDEDFIGQVDAVLSRTTPVDIASDALQWASINSWENKALEIEALISKHL